VDQPKSELDGWVEELLKINDENEKMTEKQIKIISAAIEIFSEKGYAASSTSEIAQKAGVAEGTIFRHYKTKKDLLISVVAPTMSKLIAPFVLKGFGDVMNTHYASFEDFTRAMIMNRIDFVKKNLPVIKILLQEIPFQPELKEQFLKNVGSKVLERLMVIVERYQKEGVIVDLPPQTVIRLTGSAILGFLAVRYIMLPEHSWDDEQEIEHTIRFIMYGLSS